MNLLKTGCCILTVFPLFFASTLSKASPLKTDHDWSGFYLTTKAGGVFSQFESVTSTQSLAQFDPELSRLINLTGQQDIKTSGFLSGIEGGYIWQLNPFFIGLEADLQSLSTSGTTYSPVVLYPNTDAQFVITSYGTNNWLQTTRTRIGLIANNWLFYATGGLALSLVQSDFIFTNDKGVLHSSRVSTVKPGYTAGVGVETKLTDHIGIKAEYLFTKFNQMTAYLMKNGLPEGQLISSMVRLKSTLISIGIQYYFTDQTSANNLISNLFNRDDWENEFGIRLFLSSGSVGAPEPLVNQSAIGNQLASRLIFSRMSALSEEAFARISHSCGLFIKGYLGAGNVNKGQLNDEDFPAEYVYSNTLSQVLGNLSYLTVDIGYSFIKNRFARIDAFLGYNYYAQNLNSYSCQQIAGDETCVPENSLHNFLGISEDEKFHSLRIGLSMLFILTDKLTLTTDAAYLPFVHFKGIDIHNARQLLAPEFSNHGDGSMLEAILNYQFNQAWHFGVGGRYWMWNMHNGHVFFDFLGENDPSKEPARFDNKRYGVFLQLKYQPKPAFEWKDNPTPIDWTGIYLGGDFGGLWGKSYWSDPFASTQDSNGFINIAGFGNRITPTGPFGGVGFNINWQKGAFVFGVSSHMNTADFRGENTLFSGIGGINGQLITNYFATIVARMGTTVNRSLVYVNGGRAIVHNQYTVNGNTGELTLGKETQSHKYWGWTSGFGIEYALNHHWTASTEYDYINIPKHSVTFPLVQIINRNQITAKQHLNVFKLSLHYKFDIYVNQKSK